MKYILHPKSEIDARIKRLQSLMGDLTGVLLFESIDLGYFSGTAQEGLIYVPKDGPPRLLIRKSLDRAKEESPLEVRPHKEPQVTQSRSGDTSGCIYRPGAGCSSLQQLCKDRQSPGRC